MQCTLAHGCGGDGTAAGSGAGGFGGAAEGYYDGSGVGGGEQGEEEADEDEEKGGREVHFGKVEVVPWISTKVR